MEEVTTEQLVLALSNPEYVSHTHLLLNTLNDRVVDNIDTLDEVIVNDICDYIIKSTLKMIKSRSIIAEDLNTCLGILVNLTISEAHSQVFVDKYYNGINSPFALISLKYLDNNCQIEPSDTDINWVDYDPWQYIGNVLCNLMRIETGRKLILTKSSRHMNMLVDQVFIPYYTT